MDSFFEFAAHDGFHATIIAIILLYFISKTIVIVAETIIHSITIWLKGYPPPHCDVEGNFEDDY